MVKNPKKRYVKFKFDGYAPADLAIELHMAGRACTENCVGHTIFPYEEYKKQYDIINGVFDYPHDERCEGSMCYCAKRAEREDPEKYKKWKPGETYKHPKVKNYAGQRKGRSSKKDKAKNYHERQEQW